MSKRFARKRPIWPCSIPPVPDKSAGRAPELQGSVFGYYVAGGLRGAADLDDDGRVTLAELHRYLQTEVNLWVTVNRTDTQVPMLVPGDADFALVHTSQRSPFELIKYKTVPRWDKVARMWQRHAELQNSSTHLLQPLNWQVYQRGLLRLDLLADAGMEYAEEFDAQIQELDRLADILGKDTSCDGLAAHSLPLAAALGQIDNPSREAIEKRLQAKLTSLASQAAGKTTAEVEKKTPPATPATPAKPATPATPAKPATQPAESKDQTAKKADGEKKAEEQKPVEKPASTEPPTKEPPITEPRGRLVEQHFLDMLQDYLDPAVWSDADNPARRAMQIRRQAEEAAAPFDVRTQYWALRPVASGDRLRRAAEDNLFVGTTAALVQADRLWSESLHDGYRPAANLTADVQKALALRDRCWSVTPYLAAWLFTRLPGSDPQRTQSQLDALRRLIDDTHSLAAELDAMAATGKWDATALTDATAARLDKLLEVYYDQCQELRSAGLEEQTLRGIEAVLQVPLVTGKARNQLRQRYLDIAQRRAADWQLMATKPDGTRPKVETAVPEHRFSTYLRRLAHWEKQQPQHPEHPVLSILSRAIVAPDDPGLRDVIGQRNKIETPDKEITAADIDRFYERQGALVRRWLGSIGPDDPLCKQWSTETHKLMDDPKASAATVRMPSAKAARLVRAAAPLLCRQPWDEAGRNPVGQLRRLDLHYLMLWHAARALDDFLGPVNDQKQSFFQLAATDYLRSGKSLCREAVRATFEQTDLDALLAARVKAAADGIRIQAHGDLSVVDPKDAPAIEHQTQLTLTGELPRGEAAFYVQKSQSGNAPDSAVKTTRLCPPSIPLIAGQDTGKPGHRRIGLPIEVKDTSETVEKLDYSIPNTDVLSTQRYLRAMALYRGHLRSDEFRAVPWSGVQIAWQRQPYQKPRVTVNGKSEQSRPIVFIFDCSMSMHNNRVTPTQRRIDVARDTLISILRRLVGPNTPYRIGMRIYAHRTGWDKNSDDIRIWDAKTKSAKTVPATRDRHPNSDVELICTPRRFSPKESGALAQDDVGWLLQKLTEAASHPMGETPLYLAIIQAMDDFPLEPCPKHIIAITDGKNDQYADANSPTEARKTALDVENELRKHPDVRLDIVGFDMTEDLEELTALTKQSQGGTFFSAANPKSLLEALEDSLQLSRYIVRRSGPNGQIVTPNRQPLDLNQPCIIDQAPGNRLGYVAEMVDSEYKTRAEMTLEGGEGIELFLSDDLRQLLYRRYTKNRSRAVDGLPDPLQPTRRFFVEAEIPQWQGRNVRFALSLQNADAARFSPRPAEAWLNIRPNFINASKKSPDYVFDTLDFQPGRPVPVLDYLAPDWPDGAESATLQIWFKLDKTPPDKRISLADFEKLKQLTLSALPGVTFTCSHEKIDDRYRVNVTVKYPRDTTDIHAAKVEIDPAPAEIIRRYSPEAGIVLCTFVCDDTSSIPIDRHELHITTRKSLQTDAVTLPEPMTIPVPDRGW